MNNKPRNPSAFPAGLTEGMSLRDYFAAKAIQSFDASGYRGAWSDLADDAYALADAMLAERECEEYERHYPDKK